MFAIHIRLVRKVSIIQVMLLLLQQKDLLSRAHLMHTLSDPVSRKSKKILLCVSTYRAGVTLGRKGGGGGFAPLLCLKVESILNNGVFFHSMGPIHPAEHQQD